MKIDGSKVTEHLYHSIDKGDKPWLLTAHQILIKQTVYSNKNNNNYS